MPSNWEHIKKSIKYELSDAAFTTKKFLKIGKNKLDVINKSNDLNDTFQELGIRVYNQITEENNGNIRHNPEVKSLIMKVNQIKKSIKDEEQEIKVLKKQPSLQTKTDADFHSLQNSKAQKNVQVNKQHHK